MNPFQKPSDPFENNFPGDRLGTTIVFLQFCKERVVRNRYRTGLAGLVVQGRNAAIRAAIIMRRAPIVLSDTLCFSPALGATLCFKGD